MDDTYVIQGHTFTLKPFSKDVVEDFQPKQDELERKLQEEEIDRWGYYKSLLELVADGPIEKIDEGTLDGRRVEEIVVNFLPNSMRTYAQLTGF